MEIWPLLVFCDSSTCKGTHLSYEEQPHQVPRDLLLLLVLVLLVVGPQAVPHAAAVLLILIPGLL